jgi:hypothetical protein
MDRELGLTIMMLVIFAIMALTLVMFLFECFRHLRAILSGLRKARGLDDPLLKDDVVDDDPYGVGINDKDIL